MRARKISNLWLNYPSYLFETTCETNSPCYSLAKNAISLAEGAAAGGIAYYLTGDKEYIMPPMILAMFLRSLQTRNYIRNNWERLGRK